MVRGFAIVPARTFQKGDVIFRQDDAMNGEAFLVHGEERVLKTLGRGELLGEVALFRAAPHSATAVAAEHVTLLVIPADRLEEMIRAHPRLAMALIRQLARMVAGERGSTG
jgi:CRP-like cAMP-binding protein